MAAKASSAINALAKNMSETSLNKKSSPTILDVRCNRTRDLLRGLLVRHEDANTRATFSHLMANVTQDDLGTVDRILRQNSLFSHLRLQPEFPPDETPFFGTDNLVISPIEALRPAYIVMRADQYAPQIATALSMLDVINQSIFLGSDEDVLSAFDLSLSTFGHSLALARKLAFLLGHWEKDTESWRMASRAFASYGVNARNFGMMAVADSIGVEFSYLDVKSGFESFSDHRTRAGISQKISYLCFKPITFSPEIAKSVISASYSISLLDAVLYILFHRELHVLPQEIRFSDEIENSWKSFQSARYRFDLFFRDELSNSDLRAFRAAPAFLEIAAFREFRAATQALYDFPESRTNELIGENAFTTKFYRHARDIRDLLPTQTDIFETVPSDFERDTAGTLSRSCGLVKVTESDPDFSTVSRSEMGTLMGHTVDVDRLLSTATLRAAGNTASDPFVKLILQTLLRAHSPSTKDSYQFKRSFQEFVLSEHSGSIVDFLEFIYKIDKAIIWYYVVLLDETILSQMPFIVRSAEDVYEARAKVLEWHASKTGDQTSRDKAKELRIDRKIAAVRGQINETRLNIDGIRFRQWIDASKLAHFSGFIRQESFAVPSSLAFQGKKTLSELRLTAHREPNARALLAVVDCYREFCVNADFGVASYLGRRIRHGTLRGTLLELPDPGDFDLPGPYRAQYERWRANFRTSIDAITSKLHFAGKGSASNAVISAEVDNKEKWGVLLVCLQTLYDRSQVDHGATSIPATIEQYCWYIFELELRDVQQAIAESRSEFGHFKMRYGPGDSVAIGFEKAVNIALSDRFNTVASWFKKPPNISPVAEISDIIEVVLRETRAEFPEFSPETDFQGTDLELSGSVYYHVYDALAVIVRNAGKHGLRPGFLSISATVEEQDLGKTLRLEIVTHVKHGDTGACAVRRMDEAGRAGPLNADVVEGLSGMRKLQKMKVERSLLEVRSEGRVDAARELYFTLVFPLTGLV